VTEACLDNALALPALERLGLSGANFGDTALQRIGKVTRLKELQLDDSIVTDAGLASWRP